MSTIKIVLAGPTGIGKTTLARAWRDGQVYEDNSPTCGVEVRTIRYGDQWISVWDVAGGKTYEGLLEGYFLGADAVIILGDGENYRTITETRCPRAKIVEFPEWQREFVVTRSHEPLEEALEALRV